MENQVSQLDETVKAVEAAAGAIHLPDSTKYMLWGGIGLYLFGMLLIGYLASRRVGDMKDFLVAGRRLPLWMATATLLATWFGAGSSMGVAATVYSSGIGGVLADPFAASLSLILAGIFIVGLLRRMKCLTVTDIVGRRFGRAAGAYTALWMVPVYIGWLGAQVLGMGTILQVLTGMPLLYGTLVGAAVVLLYTVLGGMWAVTLTDVVQLSLIIGGLFLIIPGALHEAGGLTAVMDNIPTEQLSLAKPADQSMVYYLGSWLIMGLGCMVGQDLVQRSLSSKNEKVAISSSIMAGFFYLAIAVVPIVIGFAARIVLAKYDITEETMGDSLDNQVLPRMAVIILGQLSPILLTLFLSALISAIMSSADSSLLAGCSLITNDVIAAIWPKLSDRTLLIITRVATLVFTVVATLLALQVQSIYHLMINSWASQLVVVFIPVVAALYVRKISRNGIWATMMVSTAVWLTYVFVWGVGVELDPEVITADGRFSGLLQSDAFNEILTCGALYGFLAGLVTFVCAWLGEAIIRWQKIDADGEAAS